MIAALSQRAVGITATFTGSEIFIYGAVERGRFPDVRDDELDFVITVTGPRGPAPVRRKSRVLGVWTNTATVEIDEAPSFYAVAASGPLDEVLSETEDLRHRITIDKAVRVVGAAGPDADPADFQKALIRLRRESGAYAQSVARVQTIGRTLFQTRVDLPSNLVEGDYAARVFLLRDRKVVDVFETRIEVRKVGMERFLHELAFDQPRLYGVLSVVIALIAGWIASEVTRLLRR